MRKNVRRTGYRSFEPDDISNCAARRRRLRPVAARTGRAYKALRMPRLRLAILGDSPCHQCTANCCKQNGHEYAVLLEGEELRKFAAFAADVLIRFSGGSRFERVIPYRHGRCPFLGDDDLCTIYDDRPLNCRRFQCITGYHLAGGDLTTHSEFLQRNPDVLERLEAL